MNSQLKNPLGILFLLGLGLSCFQNCGSSHNPEGGSSIYQPVTQQPIGTQLSQEGLLFAEEAYQPSDKPSEVDGEYNGIMQGALKISHSAIVRKNETVDSDLLVHLPGSARSILKSGIDFNGEAIFCYMPSHLSAKVQKTLTISLHMYLGSCPIPMAPMLNVNEFISIESNLHVKGDLQLVGMILIKSTGSLKIDGRLILGSGPQQPGVIIVDGGKFQSADEEDGNLILGSDLVDTGVVFFTHGVLR